MVLRLNLSTEDKIKLRQSIAAIKMAIAELKEEEEIENEKQKNKSKH